MVITRLVVLAAIVAALGCSTATTKPSTEADLAAIAAFNVRYLKAINDGDFAALSKLTNADHVMIAPNSLPIVGKAANDQLNRRATEQVNIVETWTPVETEISGDLAYQRGTYVVIATPKAGGNARTIKGSFLRIYKRQQSGEWWMTHDTFNSDGSNRDGPPITAQ
jgi:ketosteroid isomerase-like protein